MGEDMACSANAVGFARNTQDPSRVIKFVLKSALWVVTSDAYDVLL